MKIYLCDHCGCKIENYCETEKATRILNASGYYEYNLCGDCSKKLENIIDGFMSKTPIEIWNGIHKQIVAPAGTFDKLYNDISESEGDEI